MSLLQKRKDANYLVQACFVDSLSALALFVSRELLSESK